MPRDLCNRVQRQEWKFSLRCREPHVAKLRCLKATLAIERTHLIAREMPHLPDILAEMKHNTVAPRLSPAARSKYLSKLKAFLNWCENEYDIPSPGRGVTVPEPDDAEEQRSPFSAEQLHKLFHSTLYTGHGKRRHNPGKYHSRDGMFWVPLVRMFTGMRLSTSAEVDDPGILRTTSVTSWFGLSPKAMVSVRCRKRS